MSYSCRLCTLVAAVALISATSSVAEASPWTMPKDELLLTLGYDFQFAENEFLPDGTHQSFPLNGRFTSSTLRLGARYGFTSKFELAGDINFKAVNFVADSVIVGLPDDQVGLDQARSSVTNFASSELGAGDVHLTGRYNFLSGTVVLTNELGAKFPTGYAPPEGTFDEETGAVADDVSLGDGQTDLQEALLFGFFIPGSRTFGRADVGFRLRFGAPGHQVFGGVKAGQYLGKQLVLFAGASGAYTVTEGDPIGETFIATEDDLQADEVVVGENVVPVPLPLDKDWLSVEGGLIFIAMPGLELQAAYSQILLGTNIPAIHTVSAGTAIRFRQLTADAE